MAFGAAGLLPVEKVFAADNVSVKTRYGTFNGFLDKNGVKTWLGIPYAQPPVGKLRWRASQKLQPTDKTFDAKKFGFAAANDVVIVTINYRVNVFGFVNFGAIDPAFEGTGYLGLKDQVAALAWVKENISAFGGNPDSVTIFGESAGAKTMRDMMKKSSAELRQLFVTVRNARIAESVKDYLPTCDGKFLPEDPFKALRNGGAHGIKLLTGTTADEWRYWFGYFDNFFELFRDNPKNFSPVMLKYTAKTPQEIYRGWLNNRPDTLENFEAFVNQLDWRVGQELAAEYQSNFGDVYYYLFSEQSPDEKLRSCHAVDLPFTFNVGDHVVPNPNPKLVKQVQVYQNDW